MGVKCRKCGLINNSQQETQCRRCGVPIEELQGSISSQMRQQSSVTPEDQAIYEAKGQIKRAGFSGITLTIIFVIQGFLASFLKVLEFSATGKSTVPEVAIFFVAGVFAMLTIGIFFNSRIAATLFFLLELSLLTFFIVGTVMALKAGKPDNIIGTFIGCALLFTTIKYLLGGVIGTFTYHRAKRKIKASAVQDTLQAA